MNEWMKEWMNEWKHSMYLLLISLYLTTSVLKQGGGVRYSLCPAPCSSACPSPFCPSFPVSFPVSICRVENSKLRASTCSSLVSRILFNLQYTMVWPWSKQSITFQNGGKICPFIIWIYRKIPSPRKIKKSWTIFWGERGNQNMRTRHYKERQKTARGKEND